MTYTMWFRWFCILLVFCCAPSADCSADSRPAAVAGKFYPEDLSQLSATIDAMMRDAVSAEMEPPIALVVPHAGYV